MRFVGIWDFVKFAKSSLNKHFNLLFILIIALSLILPLLFLQKGVASNTSQFLQYFILLFGILAGISTARLISLIKIPAIRVGATIIIILLMIPTSTGLLYEFYSRPAYAKISKLELEALTFLKSLPDRDKVVLTPHYDQYFSLGDTTPHIWDWFDTSYVAAFSGLRTYFDDYEQVDIMGYNFNDRRENKEIIFTSEKPEVVKEKLESTNADLLYFPKVLKPKIKLEDIGLTKFYENEEIEIWKIWSKPGLPKNSR